MKKEDMSKYSSKIKTKLGIGQISTVYLLNDGRVLKSFDTGMVQFLKNIGYDIEKKIVDSFNYSINPKIKRPLEVLYLNGNFCGYIMDRAKGISFNQLNEGATINDRVNLDRYALIHNNLEQIIKGEEKIVFPDLLTCDNIYVDKNLGIELIDYDGFQVLDNPALGLSTSLGDQKALLNSRKYYNPTTKLFTKELDIKSLIHLYFLDVFNIDLNKIGSVNPNTGERISLEEIFVLINLHDYDMMEKVWKIFQGRCQNEYLGNSVFDIADNYRMDAIPSPMGNGIYLKKLRKK